jgi:hypothetical protein
MPTPPDREETTMELDELQQAWHRLEVRIEDQARSLRGFARRERLDGVRAGLRRMSIGPVIQFAVGVLIVLWAGGYWTGHLDRPELLLSGIAIHLYGLALAISAGLQLGRMHRIDYRAPLLSVQRELLALRRIRVRSERALLVAGFVVWLPMLMVVLDGVGWNLWRTHPGNVLANLGVAVALGLLVAWLTFRFRAGFERDAAGRHLREAEAELEALAREETDPA